MSEAAAVIGKHQSEHSKGEPRGRRQQIVIIQRMVREAQDLREVKE